MKYLYHFVLMCQLALLSACNPDDSIKEIPDIQGEVELLADRDQLRNDGMDAITFTVIVTDGEGTRHDVTEYSEIYESTMTSP